MIDFQNQFCFQDKDERERIERPVESFTLLTDPPQIRLQARELLQPSTPHQVCRVVAGGSSLAPGACQGAGFSSLLYSLGPREFIQDLHL